MNIDIDVKDGKSGVWEVKTFEISEDEAKMFNLRSLFQHGCREIKAGSYKKLTRNGKIIMSNTPAEIRDHSLFIHYAKQGGHILINGLGLGVALKAILESDKVKSVTVIEKSKDVIALVGDHYKSDKRVSIINDDAFAFKPPKGQRYNVVWHDIWDDICSDNLPEMTKLHRKYGRRTDWQDSWCKDLCRRGR
jgi:spermidine synthase